MALKKISDSEFELSKEEGMLVKGKVFASDDLIKWMKKDMTLKQVKNVSMLPGIINASLAMPDAHQGYGFCIGGVAAFDLDTGVISPGGVGFDINCGVRLLKTNLKLKDIKGKEKEIIHSLFRKVPSGTKGSSDFKLSKKDLDSILKNGAKWCVEKGFGKKQDYLFAEEGGVISNAKVSSVSDKAKARGINQLGTLGSGNHFLEVQVVEKVLNKKIADVFGIEKNQVLIMIHCGSRGLGHQVASDYIKLMEDEYDWPEQDRQLANAPIKSSLGKKYLSAMAAAANFAFANRQMITHLVREDLKQYFPKVKIDVVYDVAHNIAKFEKHVVDGVKKEVLVMRKGATRSFGPSRKELPSNYKKIGQPILIPGSMGTASYVLVGTDESSELSFSSTAHGAGRLMSRTKAREDFSSEKIKKELSNKGIVLEARSNKGIVEEAPQVYKDVHEVVKVSDKVGIGKLVAKLRPIGVVKG